MALVLDDRVQETTTTTGTGTVTLAGAVSGYQSFAAIGNGNTTYYCITDGTNWETGLGTYTSSGTTLARTTVIESSNSNNLVNFPAGSKNVFVTYPASQAVLLTGTQTLTNKTLTSPTIASIVNTGTLTLPTSTDTLVGRATTDTLTNKTLTSPVVGGTPTGVGVLTSSTAVASTSGTSIDFTSIPSWVKRITFMLQGVSTNGASTVLLQLGSGSVKTSGYLGSSSALIDALQGAALYTTGFGLGKESAAARVQHGALTLSLLDSSTNAWVCSGVIAASNEARTAHTGGSVALAGAIDRVRITTVNGTDTFDAGNVNLLFE